MLLSSLSLSTKPNNTINMSKSARTKGPGSETGKIARNIRLIRELRNYDQRTLAGMLHIARSTLSTWETGSTPVSIDNLVRLAEVLGVDNYRQVIDFDPDWLLKNIPHK